MSLGSGVRKVRYGFWSLTNLNPVYICYLNQHGLLSD